MASRSLAAGARQWAALVLVATAAVAADQVTKAIVRSELDLGEAVHVAGPFDIHHVRNTGIAFGLFPGAASPVTILTGIAVIWMLVYFARSGARHPVLPVALGFLVGGSVSNLVDRIRQGYVTDFLDPDYWPAFNLGDVFITVGVILLLAVFFLGERRPSLHGRRPSRP
jgi:signal peptidase II